MMAPPGESPDPEEAGFASTLDELSLWSARFGTLLLENVPLARGLRVLDLGCGTGFPLLELAETLGDSGLTVGVDPWAAGLTRARAKSLVLGLSNAHLVRADGAHLPLRDHSFDLVVSNLGINHFAAPAAVLAEAARVLRPRGRLALTTNVRGHFQELYHAYREVLAELALDEAHPALEANEEHRLSAERIEALLASAGFHVLHVVSREFTLRYADGGALLGHRLTRIGFLPGWRSVVKPADEARVLARLAKTLDDIATHEGELRMTVPMLYIEAERGNSPAAASRP